VVECKELNGTVIASKGVIMAIVVGCKEFIDTAIGLKDVIIESMDVSIESKDVNTGSKDVITGSNDVIVGISRAVPCGGVVRVSEVALHPTTIAMSTTTARHPRVSDLKCMSLVRVACIHLS
jgi:hypothetical protein